jgi:hypothetical protein
MRATVCARRVAPASNTGPATAETTALIGTLHQKLPVFSRCPKCRQLRVMDGYSRSDLERMLASGDPIEARCSLCDEIWVFSEQDRAAVRYSLGKL